MQDARGTVLESGLFACQTGKKMWLQDWVDVIPDQENSTA